MSDTRNKYDITDDVKMTLGASLRERKPARKKTLTSIVDELKTDIDTARGNGVSWDEIAEEFNRALNITDEKERVSGNTLSQAYISVKKRVEEVRVAKKASYEDLEKRIEQLEKENFKLTKEIDKYRKQQQNEDDKSKTTLQG